VSTRWLRPEELSASIASLVLRSLRQRLHDGHFAEHEAVGIALQHAKRHVDVPPGAKHDALQAQLEVAAQHLDATKPRTLHVFAQQAGSIIATAMKPVGAKARMSTPRASAKDAAAAALAATAFHAQGDEDHVRRAVTMAWRHQARGHPHQTTLRLDDNDPLRSSLALPVKGAAVMDRREVRHHMLTLAPLLRQAGAFAPDALEDALGEELWALCRPVGFTDAKHTSLLVKVPSAAFANEVQMRTPELLARVQRVAGLQQVRSVRFVVGG
jgi:hypothetical protein